MKKNTTAYREQKAKELILSYKKKGYPTSRMYRLLRRVKCLKAWSISRIVLTVLVESGEIFEYVGQPNPRENGKSDNN